MSLRGGFGTGIISPEVPVMLAGFSDRTAPATAIRDDLEARAVVFDDGATRLCLVVCDVLGMTEGFAGPVRAAVGRALGIEGGAVVTACTHTHAGPNVMEGGDRLGWPTPPGYLEALIDGCSTAAVAAANALEPAELRFARGALPSGVSINRRGHPYDDPGMAVLDVVRPQGGRIGVLANLAIHPVALGPGCLSVATDWVGPFRRALERTAGGTAVMISGALGDVNPDLPHLHAHEKGTFTEAECLGVDLAGAVAGLMDDAEPAGGGIRVARHRVLDVPVDATPLGQLTGVTESMPVELVEWALGSVRLITIPGEAFHAFGKAVESARGDRTILAGLSPVWQGYLPRPYGLGYEEMVSYGDSAVGAILGAIVDPGEPGRTSTATTLARPVPADEAGGP